MNLERKKGKPMKLTITVNIPKEKVKLLEMYEYDFKIHCESRILQDWQDIFDTEEQIQRRKKIWDNSYKLTPATNLVTDLSETQKKKPTTK